MKEKVYLSNAKWTHTHDDMGGVRTNLIFNDNFSYEQYQEMLRETYYYLIDIEILDKMEQLIDYALRHDCDETYVLEDLEKLIQCKEINNDFTHYLN